MQKISPEESPNAIDIMREEAKKHSVDVVLPGSYELKTCYLLLFQNDTGRLLDDFLAAYGPELKLLAEKVIGSGSQLNSYGVLFDEKMTMIFAFNTKLADYDRDLKRIVYHDPQEVLSGLIKIPPDYNCTPVPDFGPDTGFGGDDGPMIVARYSIPDPSKK